MTEQTEAAFEPNDQPPDEDIEWISKSQLKRDSKALQDLGKKLCVLNPEQLASLPLNEKLSDAISLAHRISTKRGALKRHYQFIGKLLRAMDVEPIIEAVQAIEQAHTHNVAAFKTLEMWRDRILSEGDAAIQDWCEQNHSADRQQLRQIVRNHSSAKDEQGKTRFARQLFKALREAS